MAAKQIVTPGRLSGKARSVRGFDAAAGGDAPAVSHKAVRLPPR